MSRILPTLDEKREALRQTDLFHDIDSETLDQIAVQSVPRRLAKDEVLVSATRDAEGVYVVVYGSFRSVREFHDGREQVLSTERPGDTIAVASVFAGGVPVASVIADQPSLVLFIDKREVHRVCRDNPALLSGVIQDIASRMRACATLVEQLSFCDVDSRVAQYLMSEAKVAGQQTERGVVLDLLLTQRQIASRVGSVREVVSRALVRLQRKGMIHVQGRRVLIPNLDALAGCSASGVITLASAAAAQA